MKKILILLIVLPLVVNATKKVSILFDPSTNPIIEGAGKSFGIRLDEIPSSDVTVSFTAQYGYVTLSSSLTFTTANYFTPQSFTITGVDDGTVNGSKVEKITISTSGGGYSASKIFYINVTDSGLDSQFISGFNWRRHIKVTDVSSIATKRAAMIAYIFNGAGLPTDDTPDTDASYTSGSILNDAFGGFTGYTSIRKLTWIKVDVDGYNWTQTNYLFIKSGATKCVFVCRGHGSEEGGVTIVNEMLAAGYSVLYSGMPVTLGDNTETNPTITGTGVNAHNDMRAGGLDRVGYSPLELFFYDKICALNYLDANYSYDDYYITGASGGGWTSAMLMAMTERFSRGVHVRGFKPAYFYNGFTVTAQLGTLTVTDETITTARDYEQYAGNSTSAARVEGFYFNTCTFFDIMIMAGSSGRTNHYSHHAADACCHNKFTFNLWKDYIKSFASTLGSGFDLTLSTNASYTTHGWNVNDRAIIASEF